MSENEQPKPTLPQPHVMCYEQGVLNGLKMVVISTQDSIRTMQLTKPYLDFSGATLAEVEETVKAAHEAKQKAMKDKH